MESDSNSYFEESSDNEEVAAPLHINLELNLEKFPESPPPGPPSPAPAPPAPIPVGELFPIWELPDDGTSFINFFYPSRCAQVKALGSNNKAKEERRRICGGGALTSTKH